jgi:hypothetical protein
MITKKSSPPDGSKLRAIQVMPDQPVPSLRAWARRLAHPGRELAETEWLSREARAFLAKKGARL